MILDAYIWVTDEITCLGNMPSANMVVPYRFSGFCMTGDQNDTNWVSVGICWGIGGSCLFSLKNQESEALSETDGLCSSEHGFGVSVCNGPLSVMQVSWAPKFKATSYSVDPRILSATHIILTGDGLVTWHPNANQISAPTGSPGSCRISLSNLSRWSFCFRNFFKKDIHLH